MTKVLDVYLRRHMESYVAPDGTKIVTKTFKDGDVVEVDATKGTVKKLQ